MDIVITLPKNLWQAICSGKKEYECRKRIPRNFMRACDKCWVVLKGTTDVVGWFTISEFLTCVDVEEIAKDYLDKLCIDREWFDAYAKHDDVLSLWKIGEVFELTYSQDRYQMLNVTSNPQSYAYCRPNVGEQRCFRRGKTDKED